MAVTEHDPAGCCPNSPFDQMGRDTYTFAIQPAAGFLEQITHFRNEYIHAGSA